MSNPNTKTSTSSQTQPKTYTPSLYSTTTTLTEKTGVKSGIKKFFKDMELGKSPTAEFDRKRAEEKGEVGVGMEAGGRMPGSGGRL